MKYLIGIIGLLLAGLLVWNVAGDKQEPTVVSNDTTTVAASSDEPINVVTSIYPLAYLAEEVIGERGTVVNLGEGQDPHDFQPTAGDIKTALDADLVLLQGAELEPWGKEIEHQLEKSAVPVFIATAGLDLYEMEESNDTHDDHKDEHDTEHGDEHEDEDEHHDEHNHGQFDPHTWLDPVLMVEIARSLVDTLNTIDAEHRSIYEQNFSVLEQTLSLLDEEYSNTLSQCQTDEVVASHDAFGYVARRYGFEIHTIGGLSTRDTPSAITLAALKEEAEHGVTTILLEENSIAAYGETLARETGLQTAPISPIVYNIPQGQDYAGLMRSNLETFKNALNCNE